MFPYIYKGAGASLYIHKGVGSGENIKNNP